MKQFLSPKFKNIILVGVGGTGSYLAQGLAKLIAGYKLDVDVLLIDPETIEEKNCARQNFYFSEVGQPKAKALAWRLNCQYGVKFAAKQCRIEDYHQVFYNLLTISCVDSLAPRKNISTKANYHLDMGNGEDYGQAIFGTTCDRDVLTTEVENWDTTPFVKHLPSPYLKANMGEIVEEKSTPSCADMPFTEQGVFVNEWASQAGLSILHQIFVVGLVTIPAIYFNFTTAQMVSAKLTPNYLVS